MAIKVIYADDDEEIAEDLEEATEIISASLSVHNGFVQVPLAIIDLSTGKSYRCCWTITLVSRNK